MNNLITVSGVSGYIDENGVAQLNLENCARGLGFTEIATSGNETIRWRTVRGYLTEFGIATSCDEKLPGYIPENIFYRLAMKASNKTAVDFQCKIADEILPAIRKTGTYSFKQMSQAELTAMIAQNQVEIERKANTAIEVANKASKQITNALDIFATPIDKDWRQAMNAKMRGICQEHELSYLTFYHDRYEELENLARVNLQARITRLRARLQGQGATKTACKAITKLEVIERDPKLKPIFEGIVRKYQAKYAVTQESVLSR